MTDEKYIVTRVDDHEMRIRKLEENDIQQRIQLTNIEKSQTEIKLMVTEQTKEQMKLNQEQMKMLGDTVKYFQGQNAENNKVQNTIKLQDRKEVWALIAGIASAVLVYLGLK